MKHTVIARDKDHLKQLIEEEIQLSGNKCDLNHIDVSQVTNMSRLFASSFFIGDISKWDTSNVKDMSFMFAHSNFNGDISKWATSKVEDMSDMFNQSKFDDDISKWDVSNVWNMVGMFEKAQFKQDISAWKPYKLKGNPSFYKAKTPIPYWANYSSKEERNQAIKEYVIQTTYEELNMGLNNCGNPGKKLKI